MRMHTTITALLVATMGCAAPGDGAGDAADAEAEPTVTGSVTYRERMALPADATIEVWIADVSPTPGATPILAETAIEPDGRQVPIPFELRYDPAAVVADRTYAVKAAIRSGGEMLFSTVTDYHVITQGNPTAVEVVLRRTPADGVMPGATLSLEGTAWRLQEIGGTAALADVEATIEFAEDGRVAGRASCNQFAGSAVVSGETISFQPLILTRMACQEPVNAQEDRYVKALEGAQRFTVSDTELLIFTSTADQRLRFTRTS